MTEWIARLRAAIPTLRQRLNVEVEAIAAEIGANGGVSDAFGRVASARPAGSWLVRWRAGKLSPDHLGCATPRQLCELATALGVTLEARP